MSASTSWPTKLKSPWKNVVVLLAFLRRILPAVIGSMGANSFMA